MSKTPIVLDIGAATLKAGFAGDGAPILDIPSIVATPKDWLGHTSGSTTIVPTTNAPHRGLLRLRYPVQRDDDSDGLEALLQRLCHDALHVDPTEHSVFLTDCPPARHCRKINVPEILFEGLGVPFVGFGSNPALALVSTGRRTGAVLDVGELGTRCAAIFGGYLLPSTVQRTQVGGRTVTDFLAKRIKRETGWICGTSSEYEIVRHIKETRCYVSLDKPDSATPDAECCDLYELPDGRVLDLRQSCHVCAETLFQPALTWASDCFGIHDILEASLTAPGPDIRKCLYENVVVCGGTACLKGLRERLALELGRMCPASTRLSLKVLMPSNPKYAAWLGAAIAACLEATEWLSKEDYEESRIHRHRLTMAPLWSMPP